MSKPEESPDSGITVSAERAGETLAALVREIVPGTSWSKARELCGSGRVWVDGERAVDPARRMVAGERIELRTGAPALRREAVPREAVLLCDADVVVVRKPAGLLTVPFEKEDRDTLLSLTRVAVRRLEASLGKDANPSLRAVQRLDKDTSGLVVFARNVRSQRLLQEQLGEHSVTRRYLALVHGEAENAIYDSLLVPDRGDGRRGSWGVFRKAQGEPPESARQATTHVTAVQHFKGATLVACELETGRQHQIRIHLAEAGHPLLGETVYIREWHGPALPAPRLMLHASVLGFVHPRTGRTVRFEDPPPDDFATVLRNLERLRS